MSGSEDIYVLYWQQERNEGRGPLTEVGLFKSADAAWTWADLFYKEGVMGYKPKTSWMHDTTGCVKVESKSITNICESDQRRYKKMQEKWNKMEELSRLEKEIAELDKV